MRCWRTGKSPFKAHIITLLLGLLVAVPSYAREIEDATHVKVQLIDHPERIVTLVPSLGELASDLLDLDIKRIVGVSEYTDYPPGLKKMASVGPYHQFNLEKVVALKPDLVLGTLDGNSKDQINYLREIGIPVVLVDTANFDDVAGSMELVAKALGNPERGKQMAEQLKKGLARIRERSKSHPPLKVMLQVGDTPVVSVGRKSFLHSSLEILGAKNIYGDAQAHYPRPSLEDVLKRNPEVIVVIALGNDLAQFQKMAKSWYQYPQLNAVKKKRVHVLKSDALLRPTLRILDGLSLLDRTLYGNS